MPRPLTAVLLAVLVSILLFNAIPLGAKHESWVEVRSPNFLVVSNAGEKQARKIAVRFEQIREVFRRSLAVGIAHPSPAITILAVKDEDSMKALLPEYWAKGRAQPAGIFIENMNQYFAAVQMDAPGDNPYDTIYHEYYHSLTLPYYPNLPLWVAEGLAEFYGNTQISASEVGMGRPDANLIGELRDGKLIPLEVLFKVDTSSPYYNEQNKTSMFYAESWALTHYLMVGDKASHRAMLAAYLDELGRGATQEQAAAKGFGDLKQLQAALYSYIGHNSFFYLKAGPPPAIAESEMQVRELSEAEADAYRAGFAAIRGKLPEAITLATEAVKLDPKLALGYRYLGFAEYESGQPKEALGDFTRAIDLDPKNALTRFLRAYLSSQSGAVADDQQIEADLRAAIAASPEFAPPYGVLAVYLATRGQNLPEALTFAKKAVTLEPGNPAYQIDLAQVLAHLRRYDDARTAALHARANATTPEQRGQADQFLVYLQGERNRSTQNSDGLVEEEEAPAAKTNAGAIPNAGSVEPTHSDAPVAGNLKEATGIVGKVSCSNGVKFEMATDHGTMTMHLKAGAQVKFRLMGRSNGSFNPCTGLQGERVTVQYEPDDAKGKSGTMAQVTVLAPGDAGGTRRLGIGNEHKASVISSAEGTVKDVTCDGAELLLTLDASDGYFTLHARDATRVQYEKDVAFDSGEFNACTELKGHEAKVTFVTVDGQKYDGEIQSVEILK